jgi:hypothetical protein
MHVDNPGPMVNITLVNHHRYAESLCHSHESLCPLRGEP